MPQAEIWMQFTVVAILILAAGLIAAAFYKLWHELLAWIDKQDNKREAEREKQRIWQEKQDAVRDERWHSFLRNMQSEWIEQISRHSATIGSLVEKVDELVKSVNAHDVWVRSKSDRE